jgi:hypothetical protein
MWTTITTSVLTAFITAFVTFAVQERKLRAELRTEFKAEQAARSLLKNRRWQKRSFTEIKKRLGGFSEDELRKVLVRAGAVRFERKEDREELWGLISKNQGDL